MPPPSTLSHLKIYREQSPPAEEAAGGDALAAIESAPGETAGWAQDALCRREAELAAALPAARRPDRAAPLTTRLEACLKAAAGAVEATAAALYVLDDATTLLTRRAAWGLPARRHSEPSRPLEGALADLEAMLGHAVVLEDARLLPHWRPPEDYASAVCVPVATAATILGTLWVFGNEVRDYDQRETNILEIVAGRLAAELQHEILVQESFKSLELRRQLAVAARLQRSQLPTLPPLVDGWDLAGWTAAAGAVGGDFYDWFCLSGGQLALAAGSVGLPGIAGAIAAGALKTALRAHAQYQRKAGPLLGQVNLTIWTASAGDQAAGMFCGLAQTGDGQLGFATAGNPGVVVLRRQGFEALSRPAPDLGTSPQDCYGQQSCRLERGEVLVVFTAGCRQGDGASGLTDEEALAAALAPSRGQAAKQILAAARNWLESRSPAPGQRDRTILVVSRPGS